MFLYLQAVTLKSYPVELSLTAWICFMGTMEGSVFAVVMERGNPAAWSVALDYKLLAAVYSVSIFLILTAPFFFLLS